MDPASKIVLGTFAAASTLAFTVSDAVLTQLIVNGSAVAIATVGAYFAFLAKVHAEKANVDAAKTLKIVNGQSGVQLQISSKFARRVADLSKSPEDEAIAVEANRLYTDHMEKAKFEAERQDQKDAEDRAVQAGKS